MCSWSLKARVRKPSYPLLAGSSSVPLQPASNTSATGSAPLVHLVFRRSEEEVLTSAGGGAGARERQTSLRGRDYIWDVWKKEYNFPGGKFRKISQIESHGAFGNEKYLPAPGWETRLAS